MIRQAISCDICGAEKKQTNHWFVAYEQAGELRVSGWNSRNRLRTGSKHLCGQACLHKLADDFMARVIGGKVGLRTPAEEAGPEQEPATDTSLTNPSDCEEFESSARLLQAHDPAPARPPLGPVTLVRMPERSHAESPASFVEEPLRVGGMSRREQAWQRERERAMRASERR